MPQIILFLGLFVVAGIIVVFIAFWGGPSAAREAYLTRGGRWFIGGMVLLYVVLGVVVPALVINNREEALGATGSLRTEDVGKYADGKSLFIENCKSCHTLAAVDAHGVTGPNLDDLAPLDKARVLGAIKRGGTGTGRMPPGLLAGADADAVATYVSTVAGQ